MAVCQRMMQEAEKATKVIDRVKRRGAANAHHHVERAGELLIRAHAHLSEAVALLDRAFMFHAMAPEQEVPWILYYKARQIREIGQEIAEVSARLNDASKEVVELAENGVGPAPKVEPPSRPKPPRRCLIHRPASAADRIQALFKRRRRLKAAAPEDAPRRVSRGRAPPFLAVCSL